MFTLKLYRLKEVGGNKIRIVMPVQRVIVIDIGKNSSAMELWAFTDQGNNYNTYYVGKPEEGMDAYTDDLAHICVDSGSWWGWGLLENSEGNTTEHYRPIGFEI